ncbi:hypothetical protein ACFVUW_15690 [Streptomyces xiamenensis]|uniref:hypothetical protein n=1 Tax=Streptomyces xiamenensis TaxID=408015 RepID=UPI0036EFE0A5
MATPTDVVTLAAGAALGSVGTDLWRLARDGFAKIFRRYACAEQQTALLVRLDGFERDLMALPAEEREDAARFYAKGLAVDLRPVAEGNSEAAVELRRLAEELNTAPSAAVVNSGVRITNNTVKGDLNFGGQTNKVVRR